MPTKPRAYAETPPEFQFAVDRARAGELKWPLYVFGDPGTGKSCAGLALCDLIAGSAYFTFTEFSEIYRQMVTSKLSTRAVSRVPGTNAVKTILTDWHTAKFWRWIDSLPLFVLDDFGTREAPTQNQYDAVFILLERRAEKPLVLTSNLPVRDACSLFDARILDRIEPGTQVRFTGRSRR